MKHIDKFLNSGFGRSFLFSLSLHTVVATISYSTHEDVKQVVEVPNDAQHFVEIDLSEAKAVESQPRVRDLSKGEVQESLPINEIKENFVAADDFVGPPKILNDMQLSSEQLELKNHAIKVKQYYLEHYADRLWNKYSRYFENNDKPNSHFDSMLIDYVLFKYLSELAVDQNLTPLELREKEYKIKRSLLSKFREFNQKFPKGLNVPDIVVMLNRILLSTNYSKSESGLANYLLGETDGINCEARAILTSIVANQRYARFFNVGWEFVIQASGLPHVRTVITSKSKTNFYPIDGSYVRGKKADFEGVLFEGDILKLLTGRYESKGSGFSADEPIVTSSILGPVDFSKRIEKSQVVAQRVTKIDPELKPELKPKVLQWKALKDSRRVPYVVQVDANEFLSQQIKIARSTGRNIVDLNQFKRLKIRGEINLTDFTVFEGVKVIGLDRMYRNAVVFKPQSLEGLSGLVANDWDFSSSKLNLEDLNSNSKNVEDVSMFQMITVTPDQYLDFIDKGVDVSSFTVDVKFFRDLNDSVRFSHVLNEKGVKYIEMVGKSAASLDFQSFNGVVKNSVNSKDFDVQFNKVTLNFMMGFNRLLMIVRGEKVNFKVLYINVDNKNFISKLKEFFSLMNGKSLDLRIVATSDDNLNQQYIDAGFKVERLDK